jgi:hypothetical protein
MLTKPNATASPSPSSTFTPDDEEDIDGFIGIPKK